MSLTHNNLSCAAKGCYATITLHPDDERRLRRTHETFYCPAGHSNYFSGKTEEEKEIDQLKARVEQLREGQREWIAKSGDRAHRLNALARAVQTCPLGCGWQGKRRLVGVWGAGRDNDGRFLDRIGCDLADHMAREHDLKVKVVDGRLVAPEAA